MTARQNNLRRYLVPVDTTATQQVFTDCLVVGGGVAGLRAALEASQHGKVTLVAKGNHEDSNTWQAQGGIASVLGNDDSIESHITDTLTAGCNLCDENIVRLVVEQGPPLVRQLLEWGTEFDLVDGKIDISLEGGHSHARVAHAHGDSTGRAIAESLLRKARQRNNIDIVEQFFAIDLLTDESGVCIGLIGRRGDGQMQIIWSRATVLATGGAGQLYRETTNPRSATADGLAMAWRAGAILQDMEFMQFHPTTLYVAGASRALITETLRGEGAVLLDMDGKRFMHEYDEAGELAPRDVVSRAILDRMLKTNTTHVYLDVRHIEKEYLGQRFPHITEICESFDIDLSRDLIPVRPSAHYMVGGVKVDADTATNIEGLFACGEAASTGLHGANRLGSNSLLEGLVFGKVAGQSAGARIAAEQNGARHAKMHYEIPAPGRTRLDATDVVNSLRALMWRNVGITRRGEMLEEAREIIHFWQRYVMDKVFSSPFEWECQNMLTVALLMAESASERQESRGVHYRQDFPQSENGSWTRHIQTRRSE